MKKLKFLYEWMFKDLYHDCIKKILKIIQVVTSDLLNPLTLCLKIQRRVEPIFLEPVPGVPSSNLIESVKICNRAESNPII